MTADAHKPDTDQRTARRREPEDHVDDLATDPVTGSTPPDPTVDEVGPAPLGRDPMGGEAPSG